MLSTIDCVLCQAQNKGLVCYPTTKASKSRVWLDCADHANFTSDSTLCVG